MPVTLWYIVVQDSRPNYLSDLSKYSRKFRTQERKQRYTKGLCFIERIPGGGFMGLFVSYINILTKKNKHRLIAPYETWFIQRSKLNDCFGSKVFSSFGFSCLVFSFSVFGQNIFDMYFDDLVWSMSHPLTLRKKDL